jgi:hypothetical protein
LRLYRNLIVILMALAMASLFWYRDASKTQQNAGLIYRGPAYAMEKAGMWSAPDDSFGDFWHYAPLLQRLHTAEFFTGQEHFAYPAPCAIAYKLLYATGRHAQRIYRGMMAAAALFTAALFVAALRRRGIAAAAAIGLGVAMLLTSEPWLTLLDRGNVELLLYLLIAGGVWAYFSGRQSLAAALWGCAGAMKLYPLALLGMFLYRKTLRPLAVGVGAFAAVTLGSLAYVGPTIAIAGRGLFTGLNGFVSRYAAFARRSELNSDHSLLGAMKEILSLHMLHIGTNLSGFSHTYEVVIAIAAPLFYFLTIRKLPVRNQLCILLLCIVFIPPVSYDYTLIHAYLAFGIVALAYVEMVRSGRNLAHATLFFVFFALLTTPLSWFHLRGLGFNGVLKAGSILGLLILLVRQPLTIDVEQDGLATPVQPA